MKSAYLNPKIKEETYLDQSGGFEKIGPSGKKKCLHIEKINLQNKTSRHGLVQKTSELPQWAKFCG